MNRTNIYLTQEQTGKLDRIARMEGISRSEVIRRIIERTTRDLSDELEEDLDAIGKSFGVLSGQEIELERSEGARARHLEEIWSS